MLNSPRRSPRDQLVTSIILPDPPSPPQQFEQEQQQQPPQQRQLQQSIEFKEQNLKPYHTPLSPSYNNEPYLYPQIKRSQKNTTFAQRQMIYQKMNLLETKVHDIQGGYGQTTALKNIYRNSVGGNQYIQEGIQQVVNWASQNVASNMPKSVRPSRTIPKSKDDIKELQKVDKYRLLKIKNGQIKNKVGDLRNQLQQQYYERKANFKLPNYENIRESDYYRMDNPKTLQANQFVHKLQKQRNQDKHKYLEYLEQKKEEMMYKKQMEYQRKKAQAEARKKRMEQLFLEKQMKRKIEEEEHLRKKEQYQNWSKVYQKQKPLYQRKQQQYIEKVLIPQLYDRKDKLFEIKMERSPINFSQIDGHDERYMEYKRDDSIRSEAQKQLQRQKMLANQQQLSRLHKGKYRYLVLEEMMREKMKLNEDPHELERQKKARQIVYADEVKQKMYEQIKLKQFQTQELQKKKFTKRSRNIDGSFSADISENGKGTSYTTPKQDGKKNLHFLKQLVREKGLKKDRPIIRLIEQKHVYPDYLEQMHEKRKNESNLHSSLNLEQQVDLSKGNKLNDLIAKQKNLSEKVKRAELRKKYNSLDYKEDANIEQDQIGAVRLKMKLVSQLK